MNQATRNVRSALETLCLADVAAYGACTLPKGHAESWHKDTFGRTFQTPHVERPPAELPAGLAWTPERATRRDVLRVYGGRLLLCDADHFALRFPTMANAVVWAEATDMVNRVKVITPTSELPLSSAIMLRLRITDGCAIHGANPCAACSYDRPREPRS